MARGHTRERDEYETKQKKIEVWYKEGVRA
jgi:hypothetical protein